jgi:steroid 5-alpha reductase family enzyme
VIQPFVLLLITAPTYNFLLLSRLPGGEAFELPDLIFSRVAFVFIILETFADQQQWKFQNAKKEYNTHARIPGHLKDQYCPEDLERGFVVSGLWSLSRHPNFASEQAIWLTLYFWSCFRTEHYLQWTGLGVVSLLLIFQGSVRLTERITASKYPEYQEYQARVGRFIPRFSVAPRYKGIKNKKKKAVQAESKEE